MFFFTYEKPQKLRKSLNIFFCVTAYVYIISSSKQNMHIYWFNVCEWVSVSSFPAFFSLHLYYICRSTVVVFAVVVLILLWLLLLFYSLPCMAFVTNKETERKKLAILYIFWTYINIKPYIHNTVASKWHSQRMWKR